MAAAVYVVSILTCVACAVLLLRSYAAKRVRLLLWGGLCFAGLALHNAFLFIDLVVLPEIDLSLPRDMIALSALCLLLYGLVWEIRE